MEEALQQQNIELIRVKEKAEESDKLKTAFIANISHEIRTPMSGILGLADLLKVPDLSSESQTTYIEAIISSSNRMLCIINDLINISKIEAGQIEIRKEVTDINKLIDELFIFFLPEANKKGIVLKINKELPVNKIFVKTDKTKLSQVITNIIKNALKYTSEGFIEFGCRMKDDSLLFYVEDTGLGIKKEHQEMIFERFKQGEVSNSGIPEGVGLGLAISKAYVEELGGTIWVKSAPTKGSVFYFTIPFKEPVVNVPSKKREEKTVKISLANILIAEDDDFIFLYLNEVLKQNNMNAIHAINGEEAVNVIKNNPNIDLIIMDGRMPVMGGLEATRKIKKIRPEIPIIALSAMAHDTDIQDALEAGCVAYLTKPIDIKVLLNTISTYVVSKT